MRFIPNMSKFDGTLSRSSWIILSVKENKIVPLLGNKPTGVSLVSKLLPLILLRLQTKLPKTVCLFPSNGTILFSIDYDLLFQGPSNVSSAPLTL